MQRPHDPKMVKPCVESKVFGIGVESYTVGSAEFALSFAATHEGVLPLMDNGHYHPTEVVSDKIPALLSFFPEIALHVTRQFVGILTMLWHLMMKQEKSQKKSYVAVD